ncbi:MAG: M23 family metallopeptidase, partial [Sphingomonas bacterium]|nr:M23 family metallopeptidase [Sphingomonas bacterium]
RSLFTPRDVLFHDGKTLRRLSVGTRSQVGIAMVGAITIGFSGYGVANAAYQTAALTGIVAPTTTEARLATMQGAVSTMEHRVASIRKFAAIHAQRLEQRQSLIAAALTGTGDEQKMALATLSIDPARDRMAADVVAPLARIEARQTAFAAAAQKLLDKRYADTAAEIRKLGLAGKIKSSRAAMGGPMIAADSAEATADLKADAQFRTLFQTWKKLDTLQQGTIAIPSVHPVADLQFTSNFGIRSDPFRGTAAMHAGVDIPGPTGTPIYATADGTVDRAGRAGGYGNLVELDHGKGIQTRYGHLSKILVADGARVRRGQLIALMGSTGRSTGPHLHYEVRIDGHAVNPVPFLTTADYLLAAQDRSVHAIPVSTDGPASQD